MKLLRERAKSWDRHGNVGLVVGATYPGELRRLRDSAPILPFLIPGIGAQAGSLADVGPRRHRSSAAPAC